eukprot:TRINITY_DN29069_c0_g2_i1.p1 TRINITY_DN29069_c0_g2~~TRINITY_DN29069_c0_g2_i1.p1  ORF type:complete len:115 (-),score=28.60 TRINITY_DN29069_c0_g2_i1:2-346(-)
MTGVIILNCAQVGAECQWQRHEYPTLTIVYCLLDFVLTLLFTLEVYIKVKKLGWSRCMASGWNVLDFALTFLMLLDFIFLAVDYFQTVTQFSRMGHVYSFGRTCGCCGRKRSWS